MYSSTNNLGNTNTNYLPNDNNNNSVDSTRITYPNSSSSSFQPIHSPSPYIFYEEEDPFFHHLYDYYLHQQSQPQPQPQSPPIVAQQEDHQTAFTTMENHTHTDQHEPIKGKGGSLDVLCNQIPRKRTSKKDRHSKINTAHGPRDRRMRLSLDVAQKFFGLQDMLGFDKASKTVQWLLTKSKTAIKQLTKSTKPGNASNTTSASSTGNNSECEVLSGIIDDVSQLPRERETVKTTTAAAVSREKKTVVTTTKGGARVSRPYNPLAKETREKARARARERTVEKRIRLGNSSNNYYDGNQAKKIPCGDQTLNRHLGSWSPFEHAAGEDESSSQIQIANDHPSSTFLQPDHHHHDPVSPMQNKQGSSLSGHHSSFDAPVVWTSPLFSYHHNTAATSHENQFGEYQCYGKQWDEVYDN